MHELRKADETLEHWEKDLPQKTRILVVDDEPGIRELLQEYLVEEGFECDLASDGKSALELLESQKYHGVISDLRMKPMNGLELLAWIQSSGPNIPVLVISAHSDIQEAVEAMKLGASDYLAKPFELDELGIRLNRSLKLHRMETNRGLSVRPELKGSRLSSKNPAMNQVLDLAVKAAPSTASLLITGESGTGKEVLARFIHENSERASQPFLALNLGGIPDNLLESELFGYEKGAFTGADKRKPGLFELAQGGTLFLDEIGDMPIQLQVKILRVLQDRKIQRLGAQTSIPIDVRIMAATHVHLEEAVASGKFREDLYYRINVINLKLPPLRERLEDLEDLTSTLIDKHRRGRQTIYLTPETLKALRAYTFKGNIRELENMVERALILASGDSLMPQDFGLGLKEASSPPPEAFSPNSASVPAPGASLSEIEAWAIQRALKRNKGHREMSAQELGISRRTLLNKIHEYAIDE